MTRRYYEIGVGGAVVNWSRWGIVNGGGRLLALGGAYCEGGLEICKFGPPKKVLQKNSGCELIEKFSIYVTPFDTILYRHINKIDLYSCHCKIKIAWDRRQWRRIKRVVKIRNV